MTPAQAPRAPPKPARDRTVVGENLSLPLFRTLSGVLAGHPYLKVVVDRAEDTWHLLDTAVHPFHVDYIATRVLGMDTARSWTPGWTPSTPPSTWTPDRRFLLGVLSLHTDEDPEGRDRPFLVLETTEADTMNGAAAAGVLHLRPPPRRRPAAAAAEAGEPRPGTRTRRDQRRPGAAHPGP